MVSKQVIQWNSIEEISVYYLKFKRFLIESLNNELCICHNKSVPKITRAEIHQKRLNFKYLKYLKNLTDHDFEVDNFNISIH